MNVTGPGLTISQLAHSAEVGVETVRYYQRRGLLDDPRPSRSGTVGRRHYGTDDARRLRFIRTAQRAGFTLEEIAELIELDAGTDRARAREMARGRIAQLDLQIAELQAARASLNRLAQDCAGTEAGPCPIIAAFTD
jgi:MerR family mercuric resistance operon transcriptional regulator